MNWTGSIKNTTHTYECNKERRDTRHKLAPILWKLICDSTVVVLRKEDVADSGPGCPSAFSRCPSTRVFTQSSAEPLPHPLLIILRLADGDTYKWRPVIRPIVPLIRREFVKGEESSVTIIIVKILTSKQVNTGLILEQTVRQCWACGGSAPTGIVVLLR